MTKHPAPPTTVGECEVGTIVRTRAGVLAVAMILGGSTRWVRLVDPTTLAGLSEPFAVRPDLEVDEVVRDQSYYAARRTGGREVDPLKGES